MPATHKRPDQRILWEGTDKIVMTAFGRILLVIITWLLMSSSALADTNANSVFVPINRSTLVTLSAPTSEVLVADPDIADVHVHNATNLTVIAKNFGHTNLRIMNRDGTVQRELDVIISYDLPAIRKALKNFLPEENIGVDMVNNSVALTGEVSNAAASDKALKIAGEFVYGNSSTPAGGGQAQGQTPAANGGGNKTASASPDQPDILNFLKVTSGQQVILKVRVGEINRTALKSLGVNLSAGVSDGFAFATGTGLAGLIQPSIAPTNPAVQYGAGNFLFPTDSNNLPNNTQGAVLGKVTASKLTLGAALQALEQDGLFKLLAEPNLVAISGEQAEFLAGGEIPIPVPQGGSGGTTITITYKPYGVAVRFKPSVLTQSLIHMEVQPEVSELDVSNGIKVDNFNIPALTTRRAKTTVELAPGEGFMIAGLLKDQTAATISQLPGAMDLPILGALFRSTEFQRNETELVIAVTPYIVDPLKNSDIKMPTDDFRPASDMEMFFYGALGTTAGKPQATTTQKLEGPTGFMVD